MRRLALALLMLVLVTPARGADPPVVASPKPDHVAISLYRDPARDTDTALPAPDDSDGLGGFALIRETRSVDLPPGPVTIRFEGVSSSILPESALLRGPAGRPREKNFDRRLLSQRGLIDAFTGQRVLLRTTDRATGKANYEPVRIRSGPEALIVERKGGFEAMQCSGLPQTMLYDAVPAGLNPVPTLSMTLGDQPGGRITLELTYLATNFDWQSNYVGQVDAAAESVDLFAWLTVASGDSTSFEKADMAVIAGRIAFFRQAPVADEEDGWDDEDERQREAEDDPWSPDNIEVWFDCWSMGNTGVAPFRDRLFGPDRLPTEYPGYADGMSLGFYGGGGGCGEEGECDSIIVTGSRITPREDIGDYKLYRVPQPTTLGALSRKQIAFLEKAAVAVRMLNIIEVRGEDIESGKTVLRIDNKKDGVLGEPLPGGQVAFFQSHAGEPMLAAETKVKDKAVGELVDFELPEPDNLSLDTDQDELDSGEGWTRYRITIENDGESDEPVEVSFANDRYYVVDRISKPVKQRDGKRIWSVVVPAEGKRTIDYRVREAARVGADNRDDWEGPED